MRIIPRVAGVSGSSTECPIRRRPMPWTTCAWFLLNPIVLLRSVIFSLFPSFFAALFFVGVITVSPPALVRGRAA